MPNQTQERAKTDMSGLSLKERFSREVPKDIKDLPVSELVKYIDTEPVRQFLVTKYGAELNRIATALRAKKISVRTNADLEGYRSYRANIGTLRLQIMEIASAGVCTAEVQEKLSKVIERVELHHGRVAKDIEGKYPDLFSTTPSSNPELKNTIPDKNPDTQAQVDTKRDALLSGKNTPLEPTAPKIETVLGAPETLGDAYATLKTLKDKIVAAQAKGNPAALIANANYQEFAQLLAATEKSFDDSKGHGMYGERIDPELGATLPDTFKKLSKLSDDIVSFLEIKQTAATSAAQEPSPTDAVPSPAVATASAAAAPEALKSIALNTDTEKMLAQSQAFREQFRGTKDIEKGRDESGKWYVKEKAKLGEELGKFYTKDLFTRVGARMRNAFGIKAAELPPELQSQRNAAETAAQAYSASLEQRYYARLGRELAAGRMTKETFDKRQLQFSSMMASRFVFQSVDMIHTAEKAALSDSQKSTFGKAAKWFGNISKGARIAIAAGGILSGAALLPGAFKIIWTASGAGAVVGKVVNDRVVKGAKENVRSTVMNIGNDFKANSLADKQALYEQSLRTLDRRKTIGVATAMAVGAGVAGGGTLAAEHFAGTFSAPDLHSHTTPEHTSESGGEKIDAGTQAAHPAEAAPVQQVEPHVELAPNAGHLYYPVTQGDTIWGHAETWFDKELRSHFIAGHDRDLVLQNLHDRLVAHPELVRELGVKTGDVFKMEYPHVLSDGTVIHGDTLDDTILGKLVNEEIAKLAAKIGTPMEQATGTHAHVSMPVPEKSILDIPSPVHVMPAAPVHHAIPVPHTVQTAFPPVPGEVMPPHAPDAVDMTHAQPIPEPITPKVSGARYEFPTPIKPSPVMPSSDSGLSDAAVAAGAGALGAGALSSLENKNVIGRIPERREVQERKENIIRLIEKPKSVSRISSFLRSISQTDTAPQTPYEVLKNMSVTSVAENLAAKPGETPSVKAAREVRKASFVRENRIDAKTFEHWMDNFDFWKSIIAGNDTKIADSMTFDTLLEKISEYQLERGEKLPS